MRHHVVLVVITLVAFVGCAGAYYAVVHDDSYTAQATVLLSPAPGNPLTPETASASGTQLAVAMETEAGIVDTPQVAQIVYEAKGEVLPRADDALSAAVPTGTQMVQISYTSSTPERARQGAQAFAEAYLAFRGTNAESTQAARIDALQAQLEEWQDQLSEATAAADDDELAAQQVQIASSRVAELNASIGAAQVVSTSPGSVTSPAITPSSADGLPAVLVLAGAALAGMVVGVILAVLAEWRRDLVREDEVREIGGLAVFATLPVSAADELVVTRPGARATNEAYRRLRAGIVANCPAPQAVAVSAVGLDLDASAAAANLAVTLGQAGFTVIVVSSNPNTDRVSDMLDGGAGAGLSEVLSGAAVLSDPELVTEVHGVDLLRRGEESGTRELFAGPDLRNVIDDLKRSYDYVVISAAGTGTADGDAAIAVADSVLLAVVASRTTHGEVSAALDRFSRLGIQPVGVVNIPGASVAVPTAPPELREAVDGSTGRQAVDREDRPAAEVDDETPADDVDDSDGKDPSSSASIDESVDPTGSDDNGSIGDSEADREDAVRRAD